MTCFPVSLDFSFGLHFCLFGLPPCVSTSPLALLTLSLDLWNCLINPAYGFYIGFRLNSITVSCRQLRFPPVDVVLRVIFTFMHLADTFIQNDLQCFQAIHLFVSMCHFLSQILGQCVNMTKVHALLLCNLNARFFWVDSL